MHKKSIRIFKNIDIGNLKEQLNIEDKSELLLVKETISILLIHRYCNDYKDNCSYKLLDALRKANIHFNIEINNKKTSFTLKKVILRNIIFDKENIKMTFNSREITLDSLSSIKKIKLFIPENIYSTIDKTLEYLKNTKTSSEFKEIYELLNLYKFTKEMFSNDLLTFQKI